jgi:hypothetical protein
MALFFPVKLEDRYNFIKFYEHNRKEIDLILWHICWKHKQLFEPRELFSELFLRLNRSYILNDFNSKKAQLHTYFTTMATCYAQHIVRKEIDRLEKTGHVVLCQGINFLGADEKAPELIAQNPDLDQEISVKELLDAIKKQCTTSERYEKFITMYLEDASQWATLASSLGISMAYAQVILHKIKKGLQIWRLQNKESFSELSFDSSKIEYEIEHKPEIKNSPEHKKGFTLNSATITKKKESVVNNKNHHPKAKVRPLTEAEIKKIRNRFIELDGVIPDDTWANLKKTMSKNISVFQITGRVVGLHREVEQGTIVLKNKRAYTLSIKARRNKWATYKSKKYQDFATRVKKATTNIAKRVKATVAKVQTNSETKRTTATVLQKICLRILKTDNTFETKEIEAKTKDIVKADIPKLLNWETVPENVLDYMVVA